MTVDTLSPLRLNILRAFYLLMAVGLGLVVWPSIIQHPIQPALSGPVSRSLLAGIGAMALLGLRHPLKMLPLLMFELLWKVIFLTSFALPLWMAGPIDADSMENIVDCLLIVILLPVLPWRYIVSTYFSARAEAWK